MTPIAATVPLMPLRPVPKGAGISVLSPASFAKPERVDRGIERLRTLGFVPRLGANTEKRGPLFFAGTPEERLADLRAAFADPEGGRTQTRGALCHVLLRRSDDGGGRSQPLLL